MDLVIMAAGIGSRFGGVKQLEPVGPNGEMLIDYSVYDALRAGFNRIVFVIKRDFEQDFNERILKRIRGAVDCVCVYQDSDGMPNDRKKPWGTAHAVLSAHEVVNGNFAVINADDFYGANALRLLAGHLRETSQPYNYCMVGFELANTLSENGYVSRGICETDSLGYLTRITERVGIENAGNRIVCGDTVFARDTVVSMNCWGFSSEIFGEIKDMFDNFLQNSDLLSAEFYLPSVVEKLLEQNKARVKVLKSDGRWYGFTYKEDKPVVTDAIKRMISENIYPANLWG